MALAAILAAPPENSMLLKGMQHSKGMSGLVSARILVKIFSDSVLAGIVT